MFRLFPDLPPEMALEAFNKMSHEDQAKWAQVDKRYNAILKNKSSELEKYKSKCTVYSVGHTHLVMQDSSFKGEGAVGPFFLHAMSGNKKCTNSGMYLFQKNYEGLQTAMKGDTPSLIEKLTLSKGTLHNNGLLLKKAYEEENRSTFKNGK